MLDTLRKYQYGLLPSYPHLSEREAGIWNRFIAGFPARFIACWYDVCVGDPRPMSGELSPEAERNRQYLGKYKIDVLAEDDEAFYVIELKHEATTKALGEIWLYDELFRRDFNPDKPVKSIVVTDFEMPNIRETLAKDGIELVVV